jgi:hypothetical protein
MSTVTQVKDKVWGWAWVRFEAGVMQDAVELGAPSLR